jgi:hypothetical protein
LRTPAALFFMLKMRNFRLLLWFGFLALVFLYFWEALTQSKLLFDRDLPIFFFPNLKLWVEGLKAGEWPLWNPYSFSGQPLLATLQACILYPPNALLLMLPLSFAFNLTIALHFFLSGWFMYLLTREIGGSRTAGTLAALSFTLGGFLLSIHNVLNTLQSVTWTPLILVFFLRAWQNGSRKYLLLGAITVLIQFLGAGIEAFLITQGLLLFLAVFPRAFIAEGRYVSWNKRFLILALADLIFLGLGALQILPFLEMIQDSIRKAGFSYQEATDWSLGWWNMLYVFLPDFFWRGHEYYKTDQNYLKSIYLGVIPFIMVFFFIAGSDRRRVWLGLVFSFSLLLALGRNTPFYRLIFETVPGMNTIRYPIKFFFLANLLLCLATGLGWDALVHRFQKDPQKKLLFLKRTALSLAFLAMLVLLILALFRQPILTFLYHSCPPNSGRPWGQNLHNIERFSFFGILIFLFFVFLADLKISPQKGRIILVALLLADLFLANWGFYRLVDTKAYFTSSPNIDAALADPEKGRIYPDPLMVKTKVARPLEMEDLVRAVLKECYYFDYPLIFRVFNTWGFGIMTYRPYQDLLDLLSQAGTPGFMDILRIMNVKFLLWHEPLENPALKLIRKGEESYVLLEEPDPAKTSRIPEVKPFVSHLYENQAVLPRAFLVSRFYVVKNRTERLRIIKEKKFDPAQTLLLEETPAPPALYKGTLPGSDRVRFLNFKMNRIDLEASCRGPRLLFLSETYYPGWKVRVDGREEKIYRADHAFRAVALGPGRHTVTFEYCPFSFTLGWIISVVTGITISSVAVVSCLLRRNLRRKANVQNKY